MPTFMVVREYLCVSARAGAVLRLAHVTSSAQSNQRPRFSGECVADVGGGSHQHTVNLWQCLELNWDGSCSQPLVQSPSLHLDFIVTNKTKQNKTRLAWINLQPISAGIRKF